MGRQLVLGESISEYVDSHSNKWWLDPDTNRVHLKLALEDKTRNIGAVVGNKFVIHRSRERHLYKETCSYGFSSEIIKGLGVEYIDLHEDEGFFRIPIWVLFEHGSYIFFKKQGFEKQLFLPISEILKYKSIPEMDGKRIALMGESWYSRLKPEFEKDYMIKLAKEIAIRRQVEEIYPDKDDIFRAFKLCPFEQTKVIMMALSPYHTPGVADGLAFSSKLATYIPPSLMQIYNAIEKDTHTIKMDRNPSLEYLAKQGVLLINRTLTVKKGEPTSHTNLGWEEFIQAVLTQLKESGKSYVALLWGKDAQSFRPYIESTNSLVLEAEHPAYAARQMRGWYNNECFNKANQFLTSKGLGAIQW